MISKNIALFLLITFFFIEKTFTKCSPRDLSINIPYLFTGITLCNGSRIFGVEIELFTKYGINRYDTFLSNNYSDEYGVFTLKRLVEKKMQEDLMLYFYHNCSLEKKKSNSREKYSINVSSLKCPCDGPTGEIKCELKAELQNKTVGNVSYPLVSIFKRKTRKKYEIEKWDIKNNISFFISKDFDNSSEVDKKIINVIKEIENKTCIIFQQQNNATSEGRGINFKKSKKCKNMRIGTMKENVSQNIYLTEECARSIRTIRSLLHQALGQLPSVFRKDRNEYVKVDFLYMNLSSVDSFNGNYTYRIKNNYSGEFDFGSITLSNSSAFSVDKSKKIIKPNVSYDNYYDNMMGRIEEPSFYDYKFLNEYYCTEKCENKINCPKPCYQDPKNCSSCACPTGYESTGDYTYNIIYSDKKVCGYNQIHASKRLQHIVISNITYCLYYLNIKSPRGHVFIRFPDFRGMFLSEECSWNNSIEIKFRKNIDHLGICLCYNKDIKAPEIVSESKHMVVIFNFQLYQSYVHFEFMEVDSTDFKYESLEKYDRIPRLLKEECNQLYSAPSDKCN